ncbi:hypothetical protein [Bradyrhizobium cajani]|uniref:Uncharacterized protein n=1 Tax=Bradyrhizobium cajani TaxID=1928661 RepID=A0A844TDQ5_9BRAD|nr:hypothetical protein [Bradyrhizobium cajani]MCP3373565.1 hypothetical protein [Bradyrhizobium cajani]MVT77178.1 hypothetical protein [Bradyrhizobium cajani]
MRPILCRTYTIGTALISKSYRDRQHIEPVTHVGVTDRREREPSDNVPFRHGLSRMVQPALPGNNNRTGELMSTSEASDRIIEPMIALAGCSPGQRIVMMDLQKRGYFLAASAGNCGLPAAQYDAALVDWRRRPLSALDAAMDWIDGFLGPRAVLVIWLDAQKPAAKDNLRAAVAKRGFVVLQGAEHPCGSALLARRSQAYPMQKAA